MSTSFTVPSARLQASRAAGIEGNKLMDYRQAGKVWRLDTYDMRKGKDIARFIARHRYSWPGGYEMAAMCSDGELLCFDCCRNEYKLIATYGGDRNSGWCVVGMVNASEYNPVPEDGEDNPEGLSPATCAHCNRELSFAN